MPPGTTKRRTTPNLKRKNNQNCQKIELYGNFDNQGVKEETFFQAGRRGGDRLSKEKKIKTMNSKMTTNSQLATAVLKKMKTN